MIIIIIIAILLYFTTLSWANMYIYMWDNGVEENSCWVGQYGNKRCIDLQD